MPRPFEPNSKANNGFRADGFSASVHSITLTVMMGLSQTILLGGINAFGYITPESIQNFFSWSFAGIPMIGYAVCAVIMIFYNLDSRQSQGVCVCMNLVFFPRTTANPLWSI